MRVLLWLGLTTVANTLILCGHSRVASLCGLAINAGVLAHMLLTIHRGWARPRPQPG